MDGNVERDRGHAPLHAISSATFLGKSVWSSSSVGVGGKGRETREARSTAQLRRQRDVKELGWLHQCVGPFQAAQQQAHLLVDQERALSGQRLDGRVPLHRRQPAAAPALPLGMACRAACR